MIDRVVFATEIAILADRYGREIKAPTIAALFDILEHELTTEEFVIGCRRVMRREAFFPSPEAIIAAARPPEAPIETKAADIFDAIRDQRIAWGKDPCAVIAMRQAGGDALVRSDDPRVMSYARRDFIAAYVAASKRSADELEIECLRPVAERAIRQTTGMRQVGSEVARLLASIPAPSNVQ